MTWSRNDDLSFEREKLKFALRAEAAHVAKLEAEAGMLGEAVVTEQDNRRLRNGIAVGWAVPAAAVTGWMATTVVEVVSVVLVIVNYLFADERRRYA